MAPAALMYARFRVRRAPGCRRAALRLQVYFTNNPPAPSRDKSFLEFYLVIEFPRAWARREVPLTFARYAGRQVAKRADAV